MNIINIEESPASALICAASNASDGNQIKMSFEQFRKLDIYDLAMLSTQFCRITHSTKLKAESLGVFPSIIITRKNKPFVELFNYSDVEMLHDKSISGRIHRILKKTKTDFTPSIASTHSSENTNDKHLFIDSAFTELAQLTKYINLIRGSFNVNNVPVSKEYALNKIIRQRTGSCFYRKSDEARINEMLLDTAKSFSRAIGYAKDIATGDEVRLYPALVCKSNTSDYRITILDSNTMPNETAVALHLMQSSELTLLALSSGQIKGINENYYDKSKVISLSEIEYLSAIDIESFIKKAALQNAHIQTDPTLDQLRTNWLSSRKAESKINEVKLKLNMLNENMNGLFTEEASKDAMSAIQVITQTLDEYQARIKR